MFNTHIGVVEIMEAKRLYNTLRYFIYLVASLHLLRFSNDMGEVGVE